MFRLSSNRLDANRIIQCFCRKSEEACDKSPILMHRIPAKVKGAIGTGEQEWYRSSEITPLTSLLRLAQIYFALAQYINGFLRTW